MTSSLENDPASLAARGREALAGRQPDLAESFFRRSLALDGSDASVLADLGRALNNLRRHGDAEHAFRAALEAQPGNADLHFFLGHVLRAQGRLDDAQVQLEQACQLDASMVRARQALAGVVAERGDLPRAVDLYRLALELAPEHWPTRLNLAGVLEVSGRGDEAAVEYQTILADVPDQVDAHLAYASLMLSRGDVSAAAEHFAQTLALTPDNEPAIAGLASAHELRNDIEAGWRLVAPLIDSGRASADVRHAAARLLRRQGNHEWALTLLEPLPRDASLGWSQRPQLYFTLGEIHDELGDADAAFENFRRANALSGATTFDPERHRNEVDRSIAAFGAAASNRRIPARDPFPVFIVGMPRSGTSLVEQILATHSLVHAGGERVELPRVAAQLRREPELTDSSLIDAASQYRRRYGPVPDAVAAMTDKLPVNFMHLGLIERLFPNARVIHCRRHPLDTMLSIYFQNFNPLSQPFASDLEHIAAWYDQYTRLMAHWRSVLQLPLIEIDYEDLVARQEPVTRELLGFLALPWEENCLRFFDTPRDVTTASYAQVRKPMYSTSVGRHRRYSSHLGSLVQRYDLADS